MMQYVFVSDLNLSQMFLGRYEIEELQLHDLPGAREEAAKKWPQAVDRRKHNVKH